MSEIIFSGTEELEQIAASVLIEPPDNIYCAICANCKVAMCCNASAWTQCHTCSENICRTCALQYRALHNIVCAKCLPK